MQRVYLISDKSYEPQLQERWTATDIHSGIQVGQHYVDAPSEAMRMVVEQTRERKGTIEQIVPIVERGKNALLVLVDEPHDVLPKPLA